MSKQQMHTATKKALAELNQTKSGIAAMMTELSLEYPDWFRVINLASIIGKHNAAQTHALSAFGELLKLHAQRLHQEGQQQSDTGASAGDKIGRRAVA